MSADRYDGFLGLELTSHVWLKNHFLAKLSRRHLQIATLPIREGEKVLDLCCGPGYYSDEFASMVGPGGQVHGVDKDPRLIDEAEGRRSRHLNGKALKYTCHDASDPDGIAQLPPHSYDVITMFNCLSYFPDQEATLSRYARLLLPGGRIILKDSDLGHFLITPFDDRLQGRVIAGAQASPQLSFDNFLGRHLPRLARDLGAASLVTEVWSYPMVGPLSSEEKTYISTNMLTLLKQGQDLLEQGDRDEWARRYDKNSNNTTLQEQDFLFLMHEIVVIASWY